jgi:hypothetical protein
MQSATNLPATLWTGRERGVGSGRGVERGSGLGNVRSHGPCRFVRLDHATRLRSATSALQARDDPQAFGKDSECPGIARGGLVPRPAGAAAVIARCTSSPNCTRTSSSWVSSISSRSSCGSPQVTGTRNPARCPDRSAFHNPVGEARGSPKASATWCSPARQQPQDQHLLRLDQMMTVRHGRGVEDLVRQIGGLIDQNATSAAADTVPATFEKIVGNLDRLHPITPVDRH